MKCRELVGLAGWLIVISSFAARGAEPEHNFAKWEKAIADFEQHDRESPPPKHEILFTGASTIARWKTLQADFPEYKVINRGFGGSEILDCTHFADRIIFPYEPRMIFLRSGGNDIHNGKTGEQVFADFKDFVATVHAKLPDTEILFISQNPTIAPLGAARSGACVERHGGRFRGENAPPEIHRRLQNGAGGRRQTARNYLLKINCISTTPAINCWPSMFDRICRKKSNTVFSTPLPHFTAYRI